MLDANPLLKYLRSKSPHTKNVIVVIAALIPTITVGYAQFYMRSRDTVPLPVASNDVRTGEADVSIFAAVGKLFDEGKKSVDTTVGMLKGLNASVLDSSVISASSSDTSAESTTSDKLDLGTVPGVDTGEATVTKSFEN